MEERRGVGCMLRTGQSILVSSSPLSLFVGSPWRFTLPLALASTRVVATRSVCLVVLVHDVSSSSLPSSSPTPPSSSFAAQTRTPAAIAAQERLLSCFPGVPAPPFVGALPRAALVGPSPPTGTEIYAASRSPAAPAALQHLAPSSSWGHRHVRASLAHGRRSPASSDGHRSSSSHGHGKDGKHTGRASGDRPVLLLLGIRLRLDGVNLVYYETIKACLRLRASRMRALRAPLCSLCVGLLRSSSVMLYTFPQSFGITGGRPSSSYDSVDARGAGLFHLGLHHLRPAVPLPRPSRYTKRNAPDTLRGARYAPASRVTNAPDATPNATDARPPAGLTPTEAAHYARAYSAGELRTFHCDRVRKMPLSGLDPSMLT
ncbi:hypothetical protein DFH09DRAFT_1359164 [Mycena vulgaris]|nr:hypothetical protein DFH09DRAFT_1359164 [Mycena vulgaris]